MVVACNSATIVAVEALRATYPIPFVGMEPGIKPAVAATSSGVVGVLATEASLAGEKFLRLVDTHAREVRVITTPCPDFVTLVEAGTLDGPEVDDAIDRFAGPALREGADVLVLGCTHYPFLGPAIEARVGQGVEVIDTGKAVARRVGDLLADSSPAAGTMVASPPVVATSGDREGFEALLPLLLAGMEVETTGFPGLVLGE